MGGSFEMQTLRQVSRGMGVKSSETSFRGIKASALARSLGLCEFCCAIAEVPVQLGFEGTKEPLGGGGSATDPPGARIAPQQELLYIGEDHVLGPPEHLGVARQQPQFRRPPLPQLL